MYAMTVRYHAFVAHSLKREIFGPAQRLHGVTLIIDAEFRRPALDENNVVMDVVDAEACLKDVVGEFGYRNLDEMPAFGGEPTTMEFVARHVHDGIAARVLGRFTGGLKVTVRESPQAWASYEAEIAAPASPAKI